METVREKIMGFWGSLLVSERVVLTAVVLLTLLRIFLAIKIPLHIQAAAVYDDKMLVDYSSSLLHGRWLGDFNQFTLAKGTSYSVFLALNYLIGLPYSFTLIFLYMIAVIIFCVAISKLIKSKVFLYILYIVMLYSPVMFHDENVQKVYRGGVIVIFALLVVAAIIGIYARIGERNKKIFRWSMLATLALVFFWFLKEDSIWIMPFVVGGIVMTLIHVMRMEIPKRERHRKILLACMPVMGLLIGILGYKTINYVTYGEFAVTDRQDTYFSEVMKDLIKIDGEGRSKDNWVTRDMLNKAYKVSPTLAQIEDEMDEQYNGWAKHDGEIEGDIVFWALKDAVNVAGFYQDGRTVNEFYKKVHNELEEAFHDGRLEKNNDFYITSSAKGINSEEMPEFMAHLWESEENVISYQYNETGVYPATGGATGIALFDEITMSQYVDPKADIDIYRWADVTVKIAQRITSIYQKFGKFLFCVFIATFVAFTGYVVVFAIKKKLSDKILSLYLVMLGIFVTCVTLFFGASFFCRFLSQKKVYDYASPMLPMLIAIEVISVYLIWNSGKKMFSRMKGEKK